MSASAASLTAEDYESRKQMMDILRSLTKEEQEEIYRILKVGRAEVSENSNGVFFDLCKLPADVFEKIQAFLQFSRKNQEEFARREEEERQAQEALRVSRD